MWIKNVGPRGTSYYMLPLTLKFVCQSHFQSVDSIFLENKTVPSSVTVTGKANTACIWAKILLLGSSKFCQWIKWSTITVISPIYSITITDSKTPCSLRRMNIAYTFIL